MYDNETFFVDKQRSSIHWLAKKISGQHEGNIQLTAGQLILKNNMLVGGDCTVNMASMTCSDLEGEGNQKIIDHLKSEDFFSVKKNPTSNFQIIKCTPIGTNRVNISGNLTIKGISQPLSFVADFTRKDKVVQAIAKHVTIDRTKYNIRYGSKSFFDSLGDKAIDDDFELTIKLIAYKK